MTQLSQENMLSLLSLEESRVVEQMTDTNKNGRGMTRATRGCTDENHSLLTPKPYFSRKNHSQRSTEDLYKPI